MGFRNPRELKGRTRGCTGAVRYATKHPALICVAVGMLIGWLATRVVSWMLLRHRGDSIDDWYAFSFLLPTEATGLWLVGLTRDEPYLAFHFIIRNASNYPVEITSIKGTISAIDGPCNVPPPKEISINFSR